MKSKLTILLAAMCLTGCATHKPAVTPMTASKPVNGCEQCGAARTLCGHVNMPGIRLREWSCPNGHHTYTGVATPK